MDYFAKNTRNEREIAMYGYVRLLVVRNYPLASVEDEVVRDFSHSLEVLSIKTVREVIFQMAELVEESIRDELKHTPCGAIMHDGWTSGGVHFTGLFACYIR